MTGSSTGQIRRERGFFTRRMFRRQYIPALASALTLAVGDMADAIVVGNRMGSVGLAAMAFALPVFMIYNVIMHSLGLGGSIRYADAMAKGQEEKAQAGYQGIIGTLILAGAAIIAAGNLAIRPFLGLLGATEGSMVLYSATMTYVKYLLWSAPLFFLSYGMGYFLRNDDMEREASISATAGNLIDIGLNILLVLILKKGVTGAGIATMSGVAVTSGMEIIFASRKKSHLKFFPFRPDWRGIGKCFMKGLSYSVSYIYSLVFLLLANNAIMRIGGENGVAVFDVIQNLMYFFGNLYGAVTQAAQPILTTYQGEYNEEGCRQTERMGLGTGLISGAIAAGLIMLFAPQVCAIFGLNTGTGLEMGTTAIRIYAAGTIIGGINVLTGNFRLARGDGFPMFLISTLRGAAIRIPAAILCAQYGETGFWFLYPITEIISGAIYLIYMRTRHEEEKLMDRERVFRATIHNRLEEVGEVTQQIEAFCEQWDASVKQHYFVQMTVEEVCSAIVEKGFQGREGARGIIQITLVADRDGMFTLHVRDSASTFNPFALPKADAGAQDVDFNAMGMQVIKERADSFYYRRYQGFNTMVVKI